MSEKVEVLVIMGSKSDLNVMTPSIDILRQFKVAYRAEIVSAHRTPERVSHIVDYIEKADIKVVIAGAGGAAHLPGVIASYTVRPVIGVPIATRNLGGLDSLYSIVQMPSDIPVATVGIDNAKNAGLMAVSILSNSNQRLREELIAYRENIKKNIEEQSKDLNI